MKQNAVRKKIAIIHPEFKWGGGEAVALWTIEALKENYDVTLVTLRDIDVASLNDFYQTNLRDKDFSVIQIPLPGILKKSSSFWLLKHHLIMRYVKSFGREFDLFFGTFNEMDFGRKGIQYIHFPVLAEELVRDLGQFPKKWYYWNSSFRKGYIALCRLLSGFSSEAMKQNITLVNSNWTGQMVKRAYGIESQVVVYPPVRGDFPDTPWNEREDGFMCIGRISPEKQIEAIIRILSFVREAGEDIHLHIVGKAGDSGYHKIIENLQQENSSWVFIEGGLHRKDLASLVSRHKYGIHGMQNEHFGIAVAEMVKAGSIVFAPNGGGQVEIIKEERLTYDSEQQAVEKILAVLRDENLQSSLREHLSVRADLFSTGNFVEQIQQVVEEALMPGGLS